jgi:putative transcriptional regulator
MTSHPLGEDIFAAYAAGALSAPMRLLLDSQAELDRQTGGFVGVADAIGGALLEEISPAQLSAGALDKALAAIAADPSQTPPINDLDPEFAGLPAAVRRRVRAAGAKWKFAGPGVKYLPLLEEGGAKAELIRIEPGRGVPQHTHEGREFGLVLRGAFSDDRGRFGPGELCQAGPDVTHKPVAEDGDICITLAVTDGPLAFTGPLGWVQRALRLN